MRKIRHGNHVKQLTIWLLFLFLGIGCPEAWGQDETLTPGATISNGSYGTKILKTGTYTLDNVTTSGLYLRIEGTVTLQLRGKNSLEAKSFQPAINVADPYEVIITNYPGETGILIANTVQNIGAKAPAIGVYYTQEDMGKITISGAIYVEAKGYMYASGIGIAQSSSSKRNVTLKDGASLYLKIGTGNGPSRIDIPNFALVVVDPTNILTNMRHFSLNIENVQGYEIENKDFVDCNFNGTTYKVYTKVRDSYEISSSKRQLPFKSNFGVTWPSYGTIDGIPFNSVHGYNLGAAYSMDGDVKTYYQTLNATFTKDIRLYADYYPFHEGTLKAGKDIVISDSNPISQVFKTSSKGLTLDASTYSIKLDIGTPNTANIKVKGKVWLANYAKLPAGVMKDEKNTPVYYCTTTIPVGTVKKITYNGIETSNFRQSGTDLSLWLPAGEQAVKITDTNNAVYTATVNVKEEHYQSFTVYPTEFNIASYSVTISTSTGGSQNVTYNSNTYASPFSTPITITGTSTSGNNVTVNNGATGNVILKDLNISGNTLPLNVTGNTTANITVAGTNNLTSTGNHALQVESGSTISLTGTVGNTLTLSATNTTTYKDVKTSGTLNLSGAFTLVAKNGTFPPTANITSGTPVVKLADTQYFRAILPNATIGTLSDMEYAGGTQVNEHLFTTTTISNNYHLWMPATSKDIVFKGSKPTAATLYTIPAATFTAHNVTLTALPVVASIGSAIYGSLADAFAAATNGQTVKMETAHTLPANTTATLSKLQAGQIATLNLGGYTLTTGQNTLLSSGKGVLKLEGTGTLSGAYALEGCLYSTLGSGQLGTPTLGGKPVYRVSVSGLPTNMGTPMVAYYRTQEPNTAYKAYSASAGSATLWLPQGQQEATIADILATVNEPVATTSVDVQMNHDNNTATASARLDIAYGDIKVTPGTVTTTVSYGSKPYAATPAAGISATNRLSILGTATPDNGKNFQILVNNGGSGTAYLNLRNVNIRPSGQKAAVLVNAATDIALEGDNQLRGGGSASGTEPAIKIASGSVRLSDPSTDSKGRLYAYGGSYGNLSSPAILSEGSGNLTIAGGTLVARSGDGTASGALKGTVRIQAGSVDALCETRPTNTIGGKSTPVYRVDVTTGLNPDQPYQCLYAGCDPSPFIALPDNAGKVYCWLPEQKLSDPKTNVTLTHPVSYEKTEIEVAEVRQADNNVAPIVIRMTDRISKKQASFGNLRDAFDAMTAGTDLSHSVYDLQLLTRINNLRTVQAVPANTDAYLDLGSFEIAAQNGSDVSFDASASGAYLQISGKGNIKNTVKIAGDVFITGVVPLTDAVVELNGKAVFRTLVKDLPVATGNTYTYSYGEQQNMPFYLHDGLACLWLPDYGRSEELRFTVSGTGGSNTEYTAGNITTVTQRTEAIAASPVGVVARLTYTKAGSSTNQPYNTLPEAFAAAGKAYAAGGAQDITVHLLTGVSVSGTLTVSGQFTLNLDGKNLTSASGGLIQAQNGARLTVSDGTAGMKGTMQVNLRMLGTGQVFIPSYIKLSGNVYKGDTDSPFYWRTTLNMNYQPTSVSQVAFEGMTYPVIDREVCLWLPADNNPAKVYTFTLGGKTMTVTGYQISANKHDNDMTLGGSNNEARIGTQEHATLKAALDAAVSGNTIELLKTVSLADYALDGKSLILELGKYELNGSAAASALTLGSGTALTVKSQGGNGKLKMGIKLDGGNLYVGQDVAGDGIGTVRSAGGTPYHRLLITNLPLNVPPGTHNFSYADLDNNNAETGTPQKGTFMVRENIGCLWLEEAIARRLRITVGTGTYDTENVTVNANHYNTETYGVKDVAQIRNGKKYADLKEAFAAAAGRTIVLLKNAALKENVTISGSVVLEMGEYTITSQDVSTLKAAITLPKGANLQITGNGSINSDFSLAAAPENGTYGNGNLQVDKGVNLTGNIRLNGELRYRVSIDGLPISKNIRYTYETQTGAVRSSASGTLCLWMNVSNKPANFYADDTDGKSYLATQVVITATHSNPISLTKVDAVAEVNGQAFDSLKDAFAGAANGNTIKLRKDADNLSGTLALNGDITATLDMESNTINAANLTLDAKKGQMLVQDGKLTGTLILSGNVFIDGDVSMTNATVAQAKKTVWRTFITLPDATASFSYKLGNETPVTCTNIHTNADGKPVACLWLPSSNVARTLTVSTAGNEYALSNVVIASTHGNELDITSGNNPVAKDGNNKQFASLASALAGATGTITLMRDLTLGTIQSITTSRTIDLANFRITSTNGGFDINAGTTLTLLRGQVLGTLSLNGDGGVSALGDVKIAGIVLDKNHEEIYRVLVKVKDATQCLWVTTSKVEEDRTIQTNHEVTIPAGLSNHNTTLTAYEVKTLDGAGSWQATYVNTRLKLGANAVLTLPEGTNATLNRLILRDGAKVTGKGQVIATEGIRYVRAITAGKWESIALPFTASRITMATDAGATTILSPAYGNGNAGNFWLRMVSTNGALINVNSPEMTANQFYLIAVPNDLGGKELTFVSGANQLLRRDKVLAVKPASGFAAYANGTLDEIQVSQPCYVLKADGKSFTRVNTATISPFRGYLLADAATTAVTPELRMAGIPTATETIVPGEPLRVSTRRGALTVSTGRSVTVRIYTMNGFPVESFKLDYGERTVFLPTGIYIVNRQKVWVD
ncbi:hypothetical protein [Parabacteroides distasonis]|jgi:hypothetical protein|uniref:hypothetical protein n=1 Tax=Parabacteroides distasonis TaxID=823 RepID=UPI00232E67C3|nr:hypothetical protein [Parabacteroides distasonis]MDB9032335.1 hypothetical protein [Parabacteroides distasonis]MDB9077252.1 hypothetical protein [Parabacteroides distasonis]